MHGHPMQRLFALLAMLLAIAVGATITQAAATVQKSTGYNELSAHQPVGHLG